MYIYIYENIVMHVPVYEYISKTNPWLQISSTETV